MKKLTKLFIVVDLMVICLFTLINLPMLKEKIISVLENDENNSTAIAIMYGNSSINNNTQNNEPLGLINTDDLSQTLVSTVKKTKITMLMTGDALIHSTVYNTHKTKSGGYDFTDIFTYTKPIIQQYDLAFYNQETILGGSSLGLSNFPQFNSPLEVGDAFVDAGFNLVSLCNNHTLDGMYRYGTKAIVNSRKYWDKQYANLGVIATGSWTSKEDRDKIVIGECKGVKYGLLAYTTVTNCLYPPKGKEYITNFYSKSKVKKDVEAYRDKVDVLIVSMHWGVDYILTPNAEEKAIAKYLSSLGVDIVIGNHGHYLQPIDMVGDTLVFYGLGNFVSAQSEKSRPLSLTGCLAGVDIIKTEVDGKVDITFENVTAQLVYTQKNQKFKVVPYSELKTRTSKNNEAMFKKFKGVLTSFWKKVEVK